MIRRERYSGEFARTFSLANELDRDAASAQYQDGVLSLTLPKKASSEKKKLTIG